MTGGGAFMRPLKLTDKPLVRDLFYRLTPESVHYRFFRMLKAMPHEKLQQLLRVDYETDMALVVLTGSSEDADMLALAHYRRDPQTNFAEAAFLVHDEWHGKGIGTALMSALVECARQNGIAGFTADVMVHNQGMLRIFHKCGFPVESTLEGGIYSLRIAFDGKTD